MCSVAPARAEPSGAGADSAFKRQSAFYLELAGTGVVYSINYDFPPRRHFAARAGVEGLVGVNGDGVLAFPITASALIGAPGRGSFEIGGGLVYKTGDQITDDFDIAIVYSMFVAFRLQPPEGGFFMRVGIGPLWGGGSTIFVWPSLSLGYTF